MKLSFDPELHAYYIDGVRMPSVTQMIAGLGLIDTSFYTEASRIRGTYVHQAIHYWLSPDGLDFDDLDPRLEGYVRAAVRFLEDAKVDPKTLETEVRVYNAALGYCGTADVFGQIFGEECVSDWKSGAIGEATGIQTALYDLANPLPGGRRRRRVGVQLRPDGTYRKRDLDRDLDKSGLDYRRGAAIVDLYKRFLWKREMRNAA